MPLRRVDTTFDLPEAHIIVGLLRSEGIDAHLFDADFVRQDWFKAIAYGGYRILVPDQDLPAAREHLHAYRASKPAMSNSDDPPCPACSSVTYRDDPRPRRWVFALYIALPFADAAVFMLMRRSHIQQFAWAAITVAVSIALALLAITYLRRRYLCDECGHRWRDTHTYAYSTLNAAHTAASDPPA